MNNGIKKLKAKFSKKDKKTEPKKEVKNEVDLLPTLDEVNERIDDLSDLLQSNLSYWKTFKIALVRGFGTVLGMTVMIAGVIYAIDKFLTNVTEIPIITPILIYIQKWLEAY